MIKESCYFYSPVSEQDGFFIAVNDTAQCCFVGRYQCTEYTEGLEITIPDEYNGVPVKRIGGYYGRGVPAAFCISLAESHMNAPDNSEYDCVYMSDIGKFEFSEEYTTEDVVFILNIGKNVEVIENVVVNAYYPHINEDGSITFFHPVVSINCSNENKHFYSKDGKLYDKKTDALISDFAYPES